jgi:hypothetical protein
VELGSHLLAQQVALAASALPLQKAQQQFTSPLHLTKHCRLMQNAIRPAHAAHSCAIRMSRKHLLTAALVAAAAYVLRHTLDTTFTTLHPWHRQHRQADPALLSSDTPCLLMVQRSLLPPFSTHTAAASAACCCFCYMLLLRQVSREVIENLNVEQLHEFVQARGFKRAAPESEPEQASGSALPF